MNVQQFRSSPYLYLGSVVVLLFFAILFKPFTIVNAGERGGIMYAGEVQIEANRVNRVYQQVGDDKQAKETIIIPAISEVLKASTPQRTAEEILKQRSSLKEEIERSLKPRLAKYGLQVDDVSLINIGFSPEFTKSIEQKQIAEQDAKKAEYEALKASRQAEAEVNRAKGTAEAQKLLKQSLNRELLEKQAIEKWDGKFPTMMSGNGALPFINITPPKN
jgi:prohibitin 1